MFIIWGKKRVTRRLGYVADFCPICRGLQTFKLKRVGIAGHIYYISFGEGKLVGHLRTCAVCDVDLDAKAEGYREIHAKRLPAGELAPVTHPDWKQRYAKRLEIERELKSVFGKIDADTRRWLLREPFNLLAFKVEERFSATHFDLRTFVALLAGLLLVVPAATFLANRLASVGGEILAAGWILAIVAVGWQMWGISGRYFREKIFPILVPALGPLKPTREELEQVLTESKARGEKLGKKLKLDELMAALGAPVAVRAAATDPTLVPGTMTPFAPAKAPPPKPAAAPAGPVSAAPASVPAPVLKLKFGGVRHRVSAADGEIMMGRAPDAQILVSAPHVSRHHATLIWDPNGYPRLVNLSQSGTSLKPSGEAPRVVDGSCVLEGEGGIGLFADYAFAEANGTVVTYEAKWPRRSA